MTQQKADGTGLLPKRLGSNQIAVRHHNERLVLQLIRRHGSLTRAQATRATGLSANAISNIFRNLEAENLLLMGEPARGKMGQPSVPASINPEAKFYLGLKVGRRSYDLAVIDFMGGIRAVKTTYHPYPTPSECVSFVKTSLTPLLKAAKIRRGDLAGFGVAMPGELWSWAEETGAGQQEMDVWRDFDMEKALSKIGPWPIFIENDGSAACRAELMFGPHADKHDFVYFFVGTLIGGGIVLDSSVFTGRTGNAGGFGPLRIPGGVAGKDRLMDQTSIFVLEQAIKEAGGDPNRIWRDPKGWEEFAAPVERWVRMAAKGLAVAAVSSLSIIDFEAVVVDGAFPDGVRDALVTALRHELDNMDLQGISKPPVEAGHWAHLAKVVGAASLPLSAQYAIDNSISGVTI